MTESNRDKLRAIMRKHNLSVKQLAAMLYKTEQTVRAWTYNDTANCSRNIQDDTLKLLEMLIKQGVK